MTKNVCGREGNTAGKEENAGYHHFLLFPQCFPAPHSHQIIMFGENRTTILVI